MPRKDPGLPVRVAREVYDRISDLVARASRDGWSSLGIERSDPPSMSAIVDEATRLLAERGKKKGKRS